MPAILQKRLPSIAPLLRVSIVRQATPSLRRALIARSKPRGWMDGLLSRSAFDGSLFRRSYANGPRGNPYSPFNSTIFATKFIIGINSVVFVAWLYAKFTQDWKLIQQLTKHTVLSWDAIKAGRYWVLLTSAFSHDEVFHFAFNMIAFWTFGSVIAYTPGVSGVHFISLCLGSAVAGSLGFLLQGKQLAEAQRPSPKIIGPWDTNTSGGQHTIVRSAAKGASGMVMGAAAVATSFMPFAPMLLMFVPAPLWAVTALYLGLDIFYLDANDRVGHAAHLGGMAYGALYYVLYLRKFGGVWQMVRARLSRR